MKKLLILFNVLLCGINLRAQQWSLISQPLVEEPISGLFFINTDTGFAVSFGGNILKTEDGFLSWSTPYSMPYQQLSAVQFVNDNVGFACGSLFGQGPVMLKTTNGGDVWNDFTNDSLSGVLYSVFFVNELKGFAGNSNGFIYQTTDGGFSWHPQLLNDNQDIIRINFINELTGFAIGTDGNSFSSLYKTSDGGATWSGFNFNDSVSYLGLAVASENFIAVGGSYHTIKKTTDGNTWTNVTHESFNESTFICGFASSDKEMYMADDENNIHSTVNGGEDWDSTNAGCCAIYSLFFPTVYMGYFGDGNGEIYKLCKSPHPASVINGASDVCAESSEIYSTNSITYADSYVWSAPPGATITFLTDTSVQVTFGTTSGAISVHGKNACGAGPSTILEITVNPCTTQLTDKINPEPGGLSYAYVNSAGLTSGIEGCSFVNYSYPFLTDSSNYSLDYIPPSQADTFGSKFPEATIALFNGNVYEFYQCTSNQWAVVGYASNDYLLHYPQPLPLFTYPMNCGDSIDTGAVVIYTNAGVEMHRKASVITRYDGYGQLIIPSYPNGKTIIRVHQSETYNDSAFLNENFIGLYISIYDNYFFYGDSSDGRLYMQFQDFTFLTAEDTFHTHSVSYFKAPVGIQETPANEESWSVYTDYTTRSIMVLNKANNLLPTIFSLVDISGRVIMNSDAKTFEAGNGRYLVPMPSSSSGLLLFRITEPNYSSTFKILQWR